MKTITNELRGIIFTQYPNATVIDNRESADYSVNAVSKNEGMLEVDLNENDTDWWNFDEVKLNLKNLQDITIEDAFHIYKNEHFHGFRGKITEPSIELRDWIVTTVLSDFNRWKCGLQTYDYLRYKCYALPYLDYSVMDLIRLGVYSVKSYVPEKKLSVRFNYSEVKLIDGKLKCIFNLEPKPIIEEAWFYKRHSEGLNWGDYFKKEWRDKQFILDFATEEDREMVEHYIYNNPPLSEENFYKALKNGIEVDCIDFKKNRYNTETKLMEYDNFGFFKKSIKQTDNVKEEI